MSIAVIIEPDAERKRALQEKLTTLLPAWFGKAESNEKYSEKAEILQGFVGKIDNEQVGLLLLKQTSPISAEIYWMGVDPKRHRSGIGRALVAAAENHARGTGALFLFVATLHPDAAYEPYQRTRRFYEALGFRFVLDEQFPADPANPLAYYMKEIRG